MLNKLKAFGLNTYESKLWMALLSRGVATAGELSDIANVPRSRSYDVLESLEKKGFIMMKLGKPIKYVAVKPGEVLERVKRKIEDEAQMQSNMIEKIKESEVLDELRLLHSKGIQTVDPGELTGSVKGRTNIHDHMSGALKNAEESVIFMTSAKGLVRKAEVLKKAFAKAKRNGIEVRIAAPITEESLEAAKLLSEYAEIRHLDAIKARFMIVDNSEMLLLVTDDSIVHANYDVGIWVTTDYFSMALKNMFHSVWDTLKPFEEMESIVSSEATEVEALN
jgi:sugar-specific transcriptional regulator TrmB